MAVDDIVRTIRDIRTFDPETLKIRPDGIPLGSLGSIIVENDAERFISVQFEFIREGLQKITKIVGVFGEGIVDPIANSLEFITVEPAPELIAEIREASTVGLESRADLALQTEPAGAPRPARPGDRSTTGLTPSTEFPNAFTLAPNTALPSGFEFINGSRNDDQVRRIEFVPAAAPRPVSIVDSLPPLRTLTLRERTRARQTLATIFGRLRALDLLFTRAKLPKLLELIVRATIANLTLEDSDIVQFGEDVPEGSGIPAIGIDAEGITLVRRFFG